MIVFKVNSCRHIYSFKEVYLKCPFDVVFVDDNLYMSLLHHRSQSTQLFPGIIGKNWLSMTFARNYRTLLYVATTESTSAQTNCLVHITQPLSISWTSSSPLINLLFGNVYSSHGSMTRQGQSGGKFINLRIGTRLTKKNSYPREFREITSHFREAITFQSGCLLES